MNFYVPKEGPPQISLRDLKIYDMMGEGNIEKMIKDFYEELKGSEIAHLFPEDMIQASKKSSDFFVFLLGGPPLYQQKHGSPMMRKRHMAFAIDEKARLEWMRCFKKIFINADQKYNFPQQHMALFLQFLERFSLWMVNKK